MTGEVIKSFLVGLGFGVDDASLAKFNKAISTATVRVTALYASVNAATTGIVYGLAEISEGFEKMGYEYRIIAPAINKALVLRNELLKAYRLAGINITKVIQDSVKLNMSLAKTRFAFEAIYRSVGSRFFGLLTKQSDLFRQKIYANMPKIQNALEHFVKFIFKAFEATTILGERLWSILTRVYDFFVLLDKKTDGWSTIILGVVAAWEALNLSFLATPLGMIITGLVALLALYDDFKTFQEGGKSLFDWGPVLPFIRELTREGQVFIEVYRHAVDVVFDFILALTRLAHLDFSGFVDSIKDIGSDVSGAFSGIGAFFSGANPNVAANIKNNPTAQPLVNPIGATSQNSQTNQNVNQQTQINVVGSADASSTGKAVASQQNRVNFDMVRNLKGATR